MKYINICFCLFLILLCGSCVDNTQQKVPSSSFNPQESFIVSVASDKDTVVVSSVDRYSPPKNIEVEETYLMPLGGAIDVFEMNDKANEMDLVKAEIVIDRTSQAELIQQEIFDQTNIIMQKLHLGKKIEFNQYIKDLTEIKTKVLFNAERIVQSIKKAGAFDENKTLHIYLFDYSSFFKTSNAMAFSSDGHKYIFGNVNLMKNAMLFIHELGHAYYLGHDNESIDSCKAWNIMHESHVGCARMISSQQSLIIGKDKMTTKNGHIVLPRISASSNDCECDGHALIPKGDKFKEYLYSRDRNIDDESLVNNFAIFTNRELIESILKGKLSEEDSIVLKNNFRIEAEMFFTGVNINKYIENGYQSVLALRKNNLLRLIGKNLENRDTSLTTEPKIESFYESLFNSVVQNGDTFDISGIEPFLDAMPKPTPMMLSQDCDQDKLLNDIDILQNDIKKLTIEKGKYASRNARSNLRLAKLRKIHAYMVKVNRTDSDISGTMKEQLNNLIKEINFIESQLTGNKLKVVKPN